MKNHHQFQLLDGTFTPSEASQVLLDLIHSKMDFHNKEKYSNEERFGRDPSHSEKRLRELTQLKVSVKELLASVEAAGQKLQIEGRLDITVIP